MAHKNAVECQCLTATLNQVSERRDLIDFFKRKRQEAKTKEEHSFPGSLSKNFFQTCSHIRLRISLERVKEQGLREETCLSTSRCG
eukprot:4277778-Amphidinium_carterae.1